MTAAQIHQLVEEGRVFFDAGRTRGVAWRLQALARLEAAIRKDEGLLYQALKDDLGKCAYEASMTEVGLVLSELRLARRKLRHWARPARRLPSLAQIPGSARIYKEPYGLVLIMSPWNYPVQLTLIPLIAAVAAGNCALVKPSAYAPAASSALARIIAKAFEPGHVAAVEGGREENQALLEERFDYIFFTGSTQVGKLVMEKAARHVTPVTLELGGKSPAIVDDSADIALAARRIAFGKLVNLGQTCIAPDYVLVMERVRDQLVDALGREMAAMVPDRAYMRGHVGRMVNQRHYERIKGLMSGQTVLYGGQTDDSTRQVGPTLLDAPAWDSPVMQEEIFGPLLPVIPVATMQEAIQIVRAKPRPLALYLFTGDRRAEARVLEQISFGGGCVNDTLMHVASHRLPFGGVGLSGMGRYHGQAGFDTFSHSKSILRKGRWPDLRLRYHPYKNPGGKLMDILFRH